jgi:hypothetical protein
MAKTISDVVHVNRDELSAKEAEEEFKAGKRAFCDVGWPPAVVKKDISTASIANLRIELHDLGAQLSRMAQVKETAKTVGTNIQDTLAVDPMEDVLGKLTEVLQIPELNTPVLMALNYSGLGAVVLPLLQKAAPVLGPLGWAAQGGIMGLAGYSAYKTHKHIHKLNEIYTNRKDYSPADTCLDLKPMVDKVKIVVREGLDEVTKQQRLRSTTPALTQTRRNESCNAHLFILDNVLPYIISKKRSKRLRKGETAAGLGVVEGMRSMGKAIYKTVRGTRGDHRNGAAAWIAYHWMQHECVLCQDIALELCGKNGEQLRFRSFKEVANALAEKMKSV